MAGTTVKIIKFTYMGAVEQQYERMSNKNDNIDYRCQCLPLIEYQVNSKGLARISSIVEKNQCSQVG